MFLLILLARKWEASQVRSKWSIWNANVHLLTLFHNLVVCWKLKLGIWDGLEGWGIINCFVIVAQMSPQKLGANKRIVLHVYSCLVEKVKLWRNFGIIWWFLFFFRFLIQIIVLLPNKVWVDDMNHKILRYLTLVQCLTNRKSTVR